MEVLVARTPLYDAHVKAGAKVVDFHGWDMPIQYSSIIEEHKAVRTAVGLFDLSHMGRVFVKGPDRKRYLQQIVTIDLGSMTHGRCRYTFFLTEGGTIIDDLLAYEDTKADVSLLVVNASNREKDLAWLAKHAGGYDVEIDDATARLALIAVQGPRSLDTVRTALDIDPSALKYYTFDDFPVLGSKTLVSRTGYTGEDGFEVFVAADRAATAWKAFVERGAKLGLKPVGLGARDTLRTEAAMPLYGNDIDDQTTPVEAGLLFALSDKVDYIGRPVIDRQRREGVAKKLIGFHLEGKRIARHGMDLYRGPEKTGIVTSGTWSPSLEKSIGLGYVKPDHSQGALEVDVRGRREKAAIVPLPFYKRTNR
ncbi:MAG: glycine cleavage system aminomethyltransferase GcvT [Planctomycetes bacterium]|nr:glycine cleavage system aminomethyltransferase GcvT [Planctomycetota bacterium]